MKYLFKRFLIAIITIIGVATLVFFIIHLIPGDPAQLILGEGAMEGDILALRHSLGLDKPLLLQYKDFITKLAVGDLGKSIVYGKDVLQLIKKHFKNTAILAGASMIFALIISFPLGILAALKKKGLFEKLSTMISVLGLAVPNFILGPLLILIFSIWLNLLPVSGNETPLHLILPALTLSSGIIAFLTRIVKVSIEEELKKPYIENMYLTGYPKKTIVFHVVKNSMIPVITILALQIGALLSGAIITEVIFSWNGIGILLIEAIRGRDYPVVQGTVLLISSIYILSNMIADYLYILVDPEIRYGKKKL